MLLRPPGTARGRPSLVCQSMAPDRCRELYQTSIFVRRDRRPCYSLFACGDRPGISPCRHLRIKDPPRVGRWPRRGSGRLAESVDRDSSECAHGGGAGRVKELEGNPAGAGAMLLESRRAICPRLRRTTRMSARLGGWSPRRSGRTETALLRAPQGFVERSSIEKPAVGTKAILFVRNHIFRRALAWPNWGSKKSPVLAEAWDALQRRDYPALRSLTGVAPVTKRSGKSCIVV
jgi:hypothetical protein